MGVEAAILVPALIGAAATVGSQLISSNGQARAARESRQPWNEQPPTSAYLSTPGAGIIAGNPPGGARLGGSQAQRETDGYQGGQNRYNSAQTLSTAPSLVGTGSGYNGAALLGQPQPGQGLGQTGVQ